MPALFLMNFLVITSSWLLVYRFLRPAGIADSLIWWFLVYLAQIISGELVLGVLRILTLSNIILLNSAVLLAVLLVTGGRPRYFLRDAFDTLGLWAQDRACLFCLAVILGFSAVKIWINLASPPFGWDSLNYHFTFAVEWLKQGNLNTPITICDDPSPTYYPINGSLIYLWFMLPLRSVFIADLAQLPFFFLACLAIYSICRKNGVSQRLAFFAAVLFLAIPNVFKHLRIAYVDMMVAALFLAGLHYLFLLNRDFSRENILGFSLSLGLLIGTKTIALPYALLLLLPLAVLALKNPDRGYLFLWAPVVIIIFGGFSYARNFFETGNPFYPLGIDLFGRSILLGPMDMATYRAHFTFKDYSLAKLLFSEGLGLQSVLVIFPAIFFSLPLALARRKKAIPFITAYLFILPLLIYLAYRFFIPLANTRYLYPLLGAGIICGLYTLSSLEIPRRFFDALVIVCLIASLFEMAKGFELAVAFIMAVFLFWTLPLLAGFFRRISGKAKSLFIYASLAVIIMALVPLERHYNAGEYSGYLRMRRYSGFWQDAVEAWDWLNSHTSGDNIAYVGRPVPFPLYGSGFKNNVYYVSLNATDPAKLHYFPDSLYRWGHDFSELHANLEAKGNYRSGADYAIWLKNLLRRRTDYLFIYSLHQTEKIAFPVEGGWAAAHPENFRRVYANNTVHIYKLNK